MRSTAVPIGAIALSLLLTSSFPPQSAGAAGEPYFVGAVLSESGPGSSLGRPEADSMQMAVDEVNKAGGIDGHPLKLTILDDGSDATTAVNDTRQLLGQHPLAIFGTPLTQTSLAISPVMSQAEVPLISYASSSQVIEPQPEKKWIFKVPITDIHIAQSLQAYMKKQGQTKIAVVYRNDDYGKTGLAHFEAVGKAAGFDVVDAEAIAATASDATTQLTHVKAANPQAILCWTTLPSATVIVKGYSELGLKTPLYYSDGAANGAFLQQAGPALNGAYIDTEKVNIAALLPNSDPQKKVLLHYVNEFVKQYPKDGPVSIFGGFGYDGIYILKAALEKVHGTPTPANIRDALEHVTYSGVSGNFRMTPTDHNGLSGDSVVLTQIRDQKFALIP